MDKINSNDQEFKELYISRAVALGYDESFRTV